MRILLLTVTTAAVMIGGIALASWTSVMPKNTTPLQHTDPYKGV
jgi:hypothetical protein